MRTLFSRRNKFKPLMTNEDYNLLLMNVENKMLKDRIRKLELKVAELEQKKVSK